MDRNKTKQRSIIMIGDLIERAYANGIELKNPIDLHRFFELEQRLNGGDAHGEGSVVLTDEEYARLLDERIGRI